MWEISWVVSHVDSLLFRTVLCERRIRTWHISAVLFPSSGSLVKTCLRGIENLTLAPLLLSPLGQPLPGKTRVCMEFGQVLPDTGLAIAPVLLAQWSPCLSPVLIPGEAEKIEDVRMWGNGGSSWRVSHLWDGSHLGRRASDQCWSTWGWSDLVCAWTEHHTAHEKRVKGSWRYSEGDKKGKKCLWQNSFIYCVIFPDTFGCHLFNNVILFF